MISLNQTKTIDNMVQYKIVVAASLCAFVSAGLLPRYHQIPSSNGFPNPTKDESQQIAMEAGGLLPPNSTLPTALDAESITTFQLIAVNELFESAFFNSLYHNVSTGVDGYQVDDSAHIAEIIRVVAAVSHPRNDFIGSIMSSVLTPV